MSAAFSTLRFQPVKYLLLISAAFALAGAGQARAEKLSIEQAERMAVQSSLEVRLARARVAVNKGLHKEAVASYYPQVSSRLIPPFIGRESGFFADQVIWDFGRTTNRVRSRKNLVDMAKFSKKSARSDAVRRARKAFFKALLEEARLVYAEKNHQLAKMRLERNLILERNGRISSLELAQHESEEKKVLFEMQTVRSRVENARFELFQLLGIDDGTGITFEVPSEAEFVPQSVEEILPVVFQNNPNLLGLFEQLESDDANIKAARAEFFPVIYGRVAYRFKGEGADTPAFIAGAGARIPIFEGFSRFAKMDRMRAARESTEIEIALEKQRLEREVRRLLLNLSQAKADIDLSRGILRTTEKRLILAREKEELGAASKMELTFAEREYAKFYLQYEESLYNRRLLLVDLSFLTGGILDGESGEEFER